MKRKYNFAAGPGAMPDVVLEQAKSALVELPGAGASIVEISHRSTHFAAILTETEDNLRKLLSIDENYRVLFLQGGAQQQFAMIPINFLSGTSQCAEYVLSGYWSRKAYREAELEGYSSVLWDGEADNYRAMPKISSLKLSSRRKARAAYVHYTMNETVQGIQMRELPDFSPIPAICDASSDLLSRPIPMERFSMIYASAQKNIGPAGLTIVIVHEELLNRCRLGLHPMLNYRELAGANSLLNTPPIFSIYVTLLVTRWIRDHIGGLKEMAIYNYQKADLLYNVIENSGGFYQGHARPKSRSYMNVTWQLLNEEIENRFITEAAIAHCIELKGHRSVGGIRASLYNAVSMESCEYLVEFMKDFLRREG